MTGGFDEAVAALTAYRRAALAPASADNRACPVIFNDYMNCLWGNPSWEKEHPLIEAASAAGCEYYVIDAGWYAEEGQGWWDSVGLWEPSTSRWGEKGLPGLLQYIRAKGMIPGLWLEIEVVGINSPLREKPDAWFLRQRGRRVIDHGRYFLDFRNPEVRAYADGVVDRLVGDYGAGYLKIDYNVDARLGTDCAADSAGAGLLAHQRAYLEWLDGVRRRYPDLVLENCGSGGGRMDYALLARTQLQSSSDQSDYRKYPAIVTGAMAAVLPEHQSVCTYPRTEYYPEASSFNLLHALLGRIHLSGNLATLAPESRAQVHAGLAFYKKTIRPLLSGLTPFFPLGRPSMADTRSPVALGLRGPTKTFVAVWRLDGDEVVSLPANLRGAALAYPCDLGIDVSQDSHGVQVRFPRKYMAAVLQLEAQPAP